MVTTTKIKAKMAVTKKATLIWTLASIDTSATGNFMYTGSVKGSSCAVRINLLEVAFL